MSGPRLRFHFHPTEPLRLGQARVALFGTLWVRSIGGRLVASNENRAALEDLEWLGIEPDAMVSRPKAERYADACSLLMDKELAYPCFCGTSEAREMDAHPGGWPEDHRYDGRCRGLSAKDQKTLRRAREPGIRLRSVQSTSKVEVSGKSNLTPPPNFDYLIHDTHQGPRNFLSRVIDENNARCTHSILLDLQQPELTLRAQLSSILEFDAIEHLILDEWECEAAQLTVHQLRSEGYLPHALLRALASTSWKPGKSSDMDQMVSKFKLKALKPSKDAPVTKEQLKTINSVALEELDEPTLLQNMVSHLTLRGYSIAERDRPWQERFMRAAKTDLHTLGDAEELAKHLLQDSAEFDRSSLRRLPGSDLKELLDQFESLMGELDEDSSRAWRRLIHKFRQEVPSPGRALSHIRVVMTGQPRGPSLASVLWLLGTEECKVRLSKARGLNS